MYYNVIVYLYRQIHIIIPDTNSRLGRGLQIYVFSLTHILYTITTNLIFMTLTEIIIIFVVVIDQRQMMHQPNRWYIN